MKLAEFFLEFAKGIFNFNVDHLREINDKFSNEELQSVIPYYCKYLTGLAFLYVYYEPSRRLVLTQKAGKYAVTGSDKIPFAASMIVILKLLKDGRIDCLQQAFSPKSEYIIFTGQNVNAEAKKIKSMLGGNSLFTKNFERISETHKKKKVTATETKSHYLEPNSDKPEDTEEYEGEVFEL